MFLEIKPCLWPPKSKVVNSTFSIIRTSEVG